MNIGCSTCAIRHFRQRFQATWRTEDRPRSRRPRVRDRYTPICAIASKLPQLLLLTPMVYITTMYLPKLCTIACLDNNGIAFFYLTSRSLPFIEMMAGPEYIYRRRNERYADCCVIERDRFGGWGSVLVWAGIAHGFRTNLFVNEGNLNAQCNRVEILAMHVIQLFQNNANIILFSMIIRQVTQLGTLWISSGRTTLHLFMTGLPKALILIPLNPFW